MLAVKLIPHLLAWAGIVLILLRGFSGRRSVVTAASISGFVFGVTGTAFLLHSFSATIPYTVIKSVLGVCFFLFWAVSVTAIYRSTGRSATAFRGERFFSSSLYAGVLSALTAM